MKTIRKLAVVIAALVSASIAQACPITITALIGDKDCFGLGGVCFDGDLILGGEDNRDPGDPLGTDQFGTRIELGGPSFDFGLDLGGATPLSASLTIFTAGIGYEGTTGGSGVGATFFFNETEIGFYAEAPGQENRAATVVFDVPIFLLSDLNTIDIFLPDLGNETAVIRKIFIIDYLELNVHAVPEPGTLALFGIGLAGMGLARRKKV